MQIRQNAQVTLHPAIRWIQFGYVFFAWLFVACVFVQVFLAGLSIFTGPTWWNNHVEFGHMLGPIVLVLLLLSLLGRFPRRTGWLSLLLFALFSLQYMFIELPGRLGMPALSALHPVNAIVISWVAVSLALQSWRFVRKQPISEQAAK